MESDFDISVTWREALDKYEYNFKDNAFNIVVNLAMVGLIIFNYLSMLLAVKENDEVLTC